MRQPVIAHLEELRRRLISIAVFFMISFLVGLSLSNILIKLIKEDLAGNVSLIVITPLEYISTLIQVGFFIAAALSFPFAAYQVMKFIKPALTRQEKATIAILLPCSVLLFIIGSLFGYFVFLKTLLPFVISIAAGDILNLWSISRFFSFIFMSCFGFGLVFELPVIIIMLSQLGIISAAQLAKKRKYVIVLLFIIAAIATPSPDALSQILLAIPLWILYEASVITVRIIEKR